jgi:ribosomal protein S18 acetylase RimI-like enzyme
VKAPAPFRVAPSAVARAAVPAIAQPCIASSRSRVVQGVFRSRPFSFPAINPGVNSGANAVQKKSAIQRLPGVDAFQVDLRPKSGGWPLPREVQAKMEAALGANFSDVRIHVGPEASAIGAIAFTWGSDLHFAPGQYNPHTPHGQFLLGHELAHVVQQRAGRVANPFGSGVAVVQDQTLEAEADRLGRMASTSRAHETAGAVSASFASQNSGVAGNGVINRKAKAAAQYSVRAPRPNASGWDIQVAVQGATQPVGSVQLTAAKNGVYISNLKVAPEHRRQGLAGQLVDAALRTARSNGYESPNSRPVPIRRLM